MLFFIFIVLSLVGLDQWIKHLVRSHLTSGSDIQIIPNLIHLTYQENKGISFSFLADLPEGIRVPLLAGISAVVVIGLLIYVFYSWSKLATLEKWGLTLIISGAIGNLLDRAFRAQVTDYMHFHFYNTSFFVNNLADDLISIGFLIMLYQSFVKKEVN